MSSDSGSIPIPKWLVSASITVRRFLPFLVGISVSFGLIWLMESNAVPQLSDVVSPSALVNEPGVAPLFPVVPVEWYVIWGIALFIWGFQLIVLLVVSDMAESELDAQKGTVGGGSTQVARRFRKVVTFVKQIASLHQGESEPNRESVRKKPRFFLRLLVLIWSLTSSLPVVGLLWNQALGGTRLDIAAMGCALGLVILLSMTAALWMMAGFLRAGFWIRFTTLAPLFAFYSRLFAGYAWQDKSILPMSVVLGMIAIALISLVASVRMKQEWAIWLAFGLGTAASIGTALGLEPSGLLYMALALLFSFAGLPFLGELLGKEHQYRRALGVSAPLVVALSLGLATLAERGKEVVRPALAGQAAVFQGVEASSGAQPLVVLTLAGGGSRAAIFAAESLCRMWWLSAAPPAGITKESLAKSLKTEASNYVFADGAYHPGRLLLIRADAISAVSGGGLAAGFLQAFLYRQLQGTDPVVLRKDPYGYRARALSELFKGSEPVDPNHPGWKDRVWTPAKHDVFAKTEQSPFVAAMSRNHLAAVIAGFFTPGSGRGPMLRNAWDNWYGWRDLKVSSFAGLETIHALPCLILNTVRTEKGNRVAITNLKGTAFSKLPPIGTTDSTGFPDAVTTASQDRRAIPRGFRGGIVQSGRWEAEAGLVEVFGDLAPDIDLSLSMAVRATSCFPYGFPVMQFELPGDKNNLELTDGGVLDNTGIDTAMALVRQHISVDQRQVKPTCPGYLVFAIDTSAMPLDPPSLSLDGFGSHLKEASNALWRAGQMRESNAVSLSIASLRDREKRQPDQMPSTMVGILENIDSFQKEITQSGKIVGYAGKSYGFFFIRLGDRLEDNVPTSWHISPDDRMKLYKIAAQPEHQLAVERAAKTLSDMLTRRE